MRFLSFRNSADFGRSRVVIFRPHILKMGEENHDLWRVFFQILPNLHNLHLLITWLFYIATSN